MLKACVIDFKGNWDDHTPLIEFAYNNSYYSSIQKAPYEAIYGRRCRYPIGWFKVGKAGLIGPNLVHQAMEKVKVIQERLKITQSCQKSYTYLRRKPLEFEVDDWVYLKVSPAKGIMRYNLSYEKVPVQIVDRQVRKLRTKEVALVKVLWRNQFVEEATKEAEEDVKMRYPYLFECRENIDQGGQWYHFFDMNGQSASNGVIQATGLAKSVSGLQ
ncbi:uncharacterized protein [Solanum lycopersicum]|uniref:uncharacterized protein n=1 Tax=Solanum lycopersicum TaxID=4081 RepID=UPI0037493940